MSILFFSNSLHYFLQNSPRATSKIHPVWNAAIRDVIRPGVDEREYTADAVSFGQLWDKLDGRCYTTALRFIDSKRLTNHFRTAVLQRGRKKNYRLRADVYCYCIRIMCKHNLAVH